jgi:mannose/fructose-specific phosphotransferase system component IIA
VIAGVNLPILVKALTYRRGPLEEVSERLMQGVRDTIMIVDPQSQGEGS